MAYREYIGSRYVPIFGRKDEDSMDWDNTKPYEPLTIVLYQGNSYTSRQYVPTGIPITNELYWALTGNYNAQIEAYRQEVRAFDTRITANSDAIEGINGDIETINGDIDTINGDNWVTENRINNDAVTTDKIADEAVTDEKLSAELSQNLKRLELHQLNFECVDRFIVGVNDDVNKAGQAGCAFKQNNVRYFAQFILATDEDYDKLIIRNLDTNSTVSTLTGNFSHGYSVSYNETTKQLVTHNTNNQLIVFDIATISNPSVQEYIDLSEYGFSTTEGYMFCWKGSATIAAINWSNETIAEFNLATREISTHSVDFDNSAMPQNINYDNGSNCYYLGCSGPNCIIVVDGSTYTQKHVINLNNYYGCVYLRELESANRYENIVYFNNYEVVDTLLVVSIFQCDLVKGTVSSNLIPYIQPSGNVGLVVDFDNGTLIPDAYHTDYKLAGDAIKAAQGVGAYGRIFLNFKSNYPYEINILGAEVAIQKHSSVSGSVTLKSIICSNADLLIAPVGIQIQPTYAATSGSTEYHAGIVLYLSCLRLVADTTLTLTGGAANPVMLSAENSEAYLNRLNESTVWTCRLLNSQVFAWKAASINALVNYRSSIIVA